MNEQQPKNMARREFLTKAAATTAALTIVQARSVAGTQANSAIELGLIGTGRRGCWIGKLFHENGNYKIVAAADVFDDRLEAARNELGVEASRCYKGMQAYEELLASKMDAAAVISPPYCHPEQADAVIEAGKHLYLAKPVATDVPGCKMILAAGKKARGKLAFWVDFQTRSTDLFKEAAKRIHEGALGKLVCGQVYYHTGVIPYNIEPVPGDPQTRLRNWLADKALSGDIIVEQNVHVTDVADWYMQSRPIKAYGTSGRQGRIGWGDTSSHFIVTFWYPNGAQLNFSSSQFGTRSYQDLCIRVYGTEGTVDSHYGGIVTITGDHKWQGGETPDIFKQGAINNIKAFEQSLRSGQPINNADQSANSTLTTILGRTAAYEGRLVTWDEMMAKNERLDPNLKL